MGKNVFTPKEADWLTNGYEAYVVVDISGGNLVANTYNLKLKSVRTGSIFDVCNAELKDDNSITWSFSFKAGQDKPVEPDPKIAPMIEWLDDDILDYIIRRLTRFTYLWNKAIRVVRDYAIHRAENMRKANGIAASSGLVEYDFFEEEEKE